jgi:outer membrane protein assembly factor BamB
MTVDQLIFVGFGGYAFALHRDTGEIVWCNSQMHSGYVSMLLDGDRLIVSCSGYMYCLDPLSGEILWHNPLKGYGIGVAHLVSVRGQSSQVEVEQAAAEQAQASSSASAANVNATAHF